MAAGYAYEVKKNLSVSATFKYLYSDMGKIGNSNGASSVAFDLGKACNPDQRSKSTYALMQKASQQHLLL